ncbi:MAG: YHS domain-containing (seleno)protein [Piscinibacter sp.]|uniref:YHS domain-containing (seleno)protein n=1 Tax=Piscinibacter sp. TaxID=1903157 RepID=UPI003D1458C5
MIVAAGAATLLNRPAQAYDENSASAVNVDASGLALKGHDPVAYFNAAKPTPGLAQFSTQHQGATYRFASAANRDAFIANPGKYAPAYGGFCAMGVALEKKLDVDPQAWRVVDGRLYLNVNKDVQKRWLDDVPGHVATAEKNWPRLKDRTPKSL